MATAAHPYIDTWAPAQYVFGSGGASGPQLSPDGDTSMNQTTTTTFDNTLHYKLAGTIVMALLTVYVLQHLGFRFVVGAGIGPS